MPMRLVVDGQTYSRAKSITVSRDLRNFVGGFSASASADGSQAIPFSRNSSIKVINSVGGTIFNGYIDTLSISQDAGRHDVRISGRDITADLVDSTLIKKKFTGPIDFDALCRQVIKEQGAPVEVLNIATGLSQIKETELVSGDIGQGVMDFLNAYAARVQAILTTNDDGRLLIMRSDQAASSGETISRGPGENSILQSSVTFSNDKNYGKYVARSAVSSTGEGLELDPVELVTQVGIFEDNSFRSSRFYEFIAETPMSSAELKDRVSLEANIRRAHSLKYSASIQGDAPSLAINTLVRVIDDFCDIDDDVLISSIRRSFSMGGTVTEIECTVAGAYSLEAKQDEFTAARSRSGKRTL